MATDDTRTDEAKALYRRRTYVSMRLPLIKEELRTLNTERKEGHEKLKGKGGERTPELKKLRQKQLYMTVRMEALKAEQQALQNERKTIMQTHRSALASVEDAAGDGD
jgi:hypothetical protein